MDRDLDSVGQAAAIRLEEPVAEIGLDRPVLDGEGNALAVLVLDRLTG